MIKHVLGTGGCGFVGVNLVQLLEMRGYTVTVLDNLSTGREDDLAETSARLIKGDLRDESAVASAVSGADAVVHLAAHTRVMDSVADPTENFEVNARGTLMLLEQCRKATVQSVVMASTGGAIIGDVTPPVHEDMVPRPVSPYGASKVAAEGYASAYAGSYDLAIVALRFANVYGPYSYHKGSVVAKFFRSYLEAEPWIVYGDGTQTRDSVYVGDIAEAIRLALEHTATGFQVFNYRVRGGDERAEAGGAAA